MLPIKLLLILFFLLRVQNLSIKKRERVMDNPKYFKLKIYDVKKNDSYFKKIKDFFEAPFIKFFYSLVEIRLD